MDTTTNKDLEQFYNSLGLDISKIALIVVGFFYGCGYLIQAITLRNYGIQRLETLKFQYIEVGVTFTVLSLLITIVPIACYLAHFRIRKKSSELPHFLIGAIGYLCNTYNLFMIIVFFALFMTNREWNSIIDIPFINSTLHLYNALLIYFAFSLPVLILLPLLERLIVKRLKDRNIKTAFRFIVEPARFSAVIIAFLFDGILLFSFPWMQRLLLNGLAFLASSVLLITVIYAVLYYMNKLGDKKSIFLLASLGTTAIFVILYMCINAYVFGIIRFLPMNRGGKMPISRAYLISDNKLLVQFPVKTKIEENKITIGPIYILEETEDFLHITEETGGEWFTKWIPAYSIKKDEIKYIINERITSGGPRE